MGKFNVLFSGIVGLILILSQGVQAATIESRFAIHNDGTNVCEIAGTAKTCYPSENIPELKLVEHGKVAPSLASIPQIASVLSPYNLIFVRDVIYDMAHATEAGNVFQVPFLASIRWVRKGIENGTLYTKGVVEFVMAVGKPEVLEAGAKVTSYSDSKWMEKYARMLNFSAIRSKALDGATTGFIEKSAGPVLAEILAVSIENTLKQHSASGLALTPR